MRQKLSIALLFPLIAVAVFASPYSKSENNNDTNINGIVLSFYDNIAIVAGDNYPDHQPNEQASIAENKAIQLCSTSEPLLFPNELDYISNDKKSLPLRSSTYIAKYHKHAMDESPIRFSNVRIMSSRELETLSQKNDVSRHTYYTVCVRKTLTIGGKSTAFNDTLTIDGKELKIYSICNEAGGVGVNSSTNVDKSYVTMMCSAALKYGTKHYEEAYDIYLKTIELYPQYAEPYYRLALMIYFKKGIKHKFKNSHERKEKLFDYIYQARRKTADNYENGVYYYDINKDAYNLYYTLMNSLV